MSPPAGGHADSGGSPEPLCLAWRGPRDEAQVAPGR